MWKLHSKRVEKMWKLHSKRVEKIDYTTQLRFLKNCDFRSVPLLSFWCKFQQNTKNEQTENYTRNEWRRCENHTRNEWRWCKNYTRNECKHHTSIELIFDYPSRSVRLAELGLISSGMGATNSKLVRWIQTKNLCNSRRRAITIAGTVGRQLVHSYVGRVEKIVESNPLAKMHRFALGDGLKSQRNKDPKASPTNHLTKKKISYRRGKVGKRWIF